MSTIVAVNGKIETSDYWPEGTPAGYDVSFEDEDGTAYTPASTIAAKVYSRPGSLIETLASLTAATSVEVTTGGSANVIGAYGQERVIFLEWTAVTTRYPAPGITQRCEIHYSITDLVGA